MKKQGLVKLFVMSLMIPMIFVILFPAFTFFSSRSLRQEIQALDDENMFLAFTAQSMRYDTVQVQQFLSDISATRGLDGLDDGFVKAGEARKDFDQHIKELESFYKARNQNQNLELVNQLSAAMAVFHSTGEKMAHRYVEEGPSGGNSLMPEFDKASEDLATVLEKFTTSQRQDLDQKLDGVETLMDRTSTMIQIAAAVFMVMLIVLMIFSVNRARQVAKEVVAVLTRESLEIATTSETLLEASQALASSTEEQAAAVQENAASMTEISATIRQTAENSKTAQSRSTRVSEDAQKGRTIVSDLVTAMATVQKSHENLNSIIQTVGKISDKTAVINDIVFKTQLLSFNASIEAARAGQHGRGFSVVAEEVGNLADLSGKAANEIRSIIQESQVQIRDFIGKTQSSIDHVAEITGNVQNIFHNITQDVESIQKQMEDVSRSNTEQQRGIEELTLASRQIDQATTNNSHMSLDVDNHAKSLRAQSEKLAALCDSVSLMLLGQILKSETSLSCETPLIGSDDTKSLPPLRLAS